MKLSQLMGPEAHLTGPDVEITGMTADSRRVAAGCLFAALPGTKVDGATFAADAIAQGAAALLLPAGAPVPANATTVVTATEPRRALALMAARFHRQQPAKIVAITGTNGKTSVAEFTRQLCAAQDVPAASLGTLGIVKPGGAVEGALTTPDPITLAATLASLAHEGITHLALEASSHGLDQYRLDGVRLTAGAFTNLGRDHLDYLPTVEAYLAAKLRLFSELLEPGQTAVINADGPRAADAIAAARARGLQIVTTGEAGVDIRLVVVARDGFRQRLRIAYGGREHAVQLGLIGTYQASNALVAAGLAIACGVDAVTTIRAIETLEGVPGRLEVAAEHRGGTAVIDYAHKPEALDAALDALRPFATGRLITVFGCGGDRDRGKRPIMGRIAAEKSDVVIVTDDNPRSEAPAAIRAEVMAGCPDAREIGDRTEAIRAGVALLGRGDVLLIAGKGHETGQKIGDTVIPFSDHDAVRAAIGGA